MMAYSRVRHLIHSCPFLCSCLWSWRSLHVQEAAARKSLFLNPNRINAPFSRGCCPDANSSFSELVRRTYFVAAQSWTCFLCEEPEEGEDGSMRDLRIFLFPLLSNWSFSSSLAGLFPPGFPWALLLSSSLSMAAVRHPCMCSQGVLTGCAGYFNVGGLWRLDIPGQGVSCVRASPPHQLYNGVIVLTCSLNPADRYCTVEGCTIVCAIIQIPN